MHIIDIWIGLDLFIFLAANKPSQTDTGLYALLMGSAATTFPAR